MKASTSNQANEKVTIQVGDFIKAMGTTLCGFVVRMGSVQYGRGRFLPAYVITDCHGHEQVIVAEEALFVA